jgi:hypothetical protein
MLTNGSAAIAGKKRRAHEPFTASRAGVNSLQSAASLGSRFRNPPFLKSDSLLWLCASGSFQASRYAGHPAKDGITEK